jgi:hypothetical protein
MLRSAAIMLVSAGFLNRDLTRLRVQLHQLAGIVQFSGLLQKGLPPIPEVRNDSANHFDDAPRCCAARWS